MQASRCTVKAGHAFSATARPRFLCRDSLTAAGQPVPLASRDHDLLVEKLNTVLQNVQAKTRKALAKAVRVVHVAEARYDQNKWRNTPRCTGLDMDIVWEAEQLNKKEKEPSPPLQGLARVKLYTGGVDRVVVSDIQVMDTADKDLPCPMPSSEPAPPEVLLAVQSMDSAIMEHLNDLMWEMEQSKEFPLASFDLDEEPLPQPAVSQGGESTASPSA